MSLFGEKEMCAVCGGKVGLIKTKIADGVICGDCFLKCSRMATSIKLKTTEEVAEHIRQRTENLERYKTYKPTDEVGNYFKVDRKSQTWCCPTLDKKNPDIFSFSDVLDYELNEDGVSITSGGLGSAIVGGAVLGGVGAIVGGGLGKKQKDVVNKLSAIITVRNDFISKVEIPLITSETKKGGILYKASKECGNKIISLLTVMTDAATQPAQSASAATASVADEIRKYKELLDMGAITQEEYDQKKKQLLGL